MTLRTTGEPVVTQEGTEARIGIDLRPGSLILIQTGEDFVAHHAWVYFSSCQPAPGSCRRSGSPRRGRTAGRWGWPWISSTRTSTVPERGTQVGCRTRSCRSAPRPDGPAAQALRQTLLTGYGQAPSQQRSGRPQGYAEVGAIRRPRAFPRA